MLERALYITVRVKEEEAAVAHQQEAALSKVNLAPVEFAFFPIFWARFFGG